MKKAVILILMALVILVAYTAALANTPAEDITNAPAAREELTDVFVSIIPEI